MPDPSIKRVFILLAISISLTACEPNEMYPVGGIPIPGSNSGSGTAPQTAPQNLAPMMQDPESETNQSNDYVWADSESQAWQKSQQEADRMTRDGGSVVRVATVRRANKKGTYWQCNYEGER